MKMYYTGTDVEMDGRKSKTMSVQKDILLSFLGIIYQEKLGHSIIYQLFNIFYESLKQNQKHRVN